MTRPGSEAESCSEPEGTLTATPLQRECGPVCRGDGGRVEAPVRGSLQEASPSPLPNSRSYRMLLHQAIFPGGLSSGTSTSVLGFTLRPQQVIFSACGESLAGLQARRDQSADLRFPCALRSVSRHAHRCPASVRLCLEKVWEVTGQCRARKAQNNPETRQGLSLPGEGRQLRDLQLGLRVERGHLCWGLPRPRTLSHATHPI